MPLTLSDFERACLSEAEALEDRMLRYISSPREHDLALPAAWQLIRLQLEIAFNAK